MTADPRPDHRRERVTEGAPLRRPTGAPTAARRVKLLLHAMLAGAFLVAYATGDEDTYAMHLAAGYLALVVLTVRLGAAAGLPGLPVLALPRPGPIADLGRRPWSALPWLSAAMLAAVAAAGISGIAADRLPPGWPEAVHRAIGQAAIWAAFAHIAYAGLLYARTRLALRLPRDRAVQSAPAGAPLTPRRRDHQLPAQAGAALLLALACAGPAVAGPATDQLLAGYADQARRDDPTFTGFSAERGRALYLGPHTGGRSEFKACADCHTADPTRAGQHAKTGRVIEPMAAWVNPDRFTDPAKVEKRFSRDCPSILGRDCSARDKGDFVFYLTHPPRTAP